MISKPQNYFLIVYFFFPYQYSYLYVSSSIFQMEWDFGSFTYPPIWNDETAVYSLYQPFKRSRNADPSGFNNKLNFWTNLIQDYCLHHHIILISENNLKEIFSRSLKCTGRSHQPECLSAVMWEMWSTPGVLYPLSDYSTRGLITKFAGIGFDWFVKKPVSWSWNTVFGGNRRERAIKTVDSPDADFVLDSSITRLANGFLTWLAGSTFIHLRPSQELNVVLKNHFEAALTSYFPHEPTRTFIRAWLQHHRRFVEKSQEVNTQSIEVVKFASNTSESPIQFTEDDRSLLVVLQLRDVISKLEHEAGHLQTSLDERKVAVKGLMRERRKNEALRLFRRCKVIEKVLDQKHQQIEKVETLLVQIESSKGNRTMIGALTLANKAMKEALGDTSRDSIEDTLADLQDTYDQHQDVASVLSDVGPAGADEDELEAELESLLDAGQAKKRPTMMIDTEDLDRQLADLDLSLELPDVSDLPLPSIGDLKQKDARLTN